MFDRDDNISREEMIHNVEHGLYMHDKTTNEHFLECECKDRRHLLMVHRGLDDWFPLFELQPQLNFNQPWYKRILIAIKYIFTGKDNGAWGCLMVTNKDVRHLKDICEDHLQLLDDLRYKGINVTED